MNIEEISKELKKLQYHVKIIGECLDYKLNPLESLILSMNWDDSQIKKAHNIFEKYDNKLLEKEDVNWKEFEMALKDEFSIGNQAIKAIILAFHRNHQWMEVCRGYAMSFEPSTPVEFHSITKRNE